ncbi:MAG TPA: hypothetical protein VJH03_13760 [Blastocatellia bacterium]|nr:hypothetical protein [Blastocatellia bacterium]
MRIQSSRLVPPFARCFRPATSAVLLVLLLAPGAAGQQPPTSKKRVPKLSTEDVLGPRSEQATSETRVDTSAVKPGDAATAQAAQAQGAEKKPNPEESAWRERVKAAREKSAAAERAAEEGELRTTELRNELGISGQSAKQRNETAAALDEAGRRLVELRAQARQAASELNALLNEGRQKGFADPPDAGAPPAGGKADEQYYRDRYAKLIEALQTAERRIRLYEDRIRAYNERLNNPNVDRFATAQLRQDRDDAQQKVEESRAAAAKAQSDIDGLIDEARRAGLPPSVFR